MTRTKRLIPHTAMDYSRGHYAFTCGDRVRWLGGDRVFAVGTILQGAARLYPVDRKDGDPPSYLAWASDCDLID